jgi:predicted ribosome quality control (RQC) complex YloA/Tae2 family protein
MYLDAFTVSALVDEFLDTLVGGRIQDVVEVDSTSIGMEIYADRRRRYLYISADHQTPRIHTLDEKLRRGTPKPGQLVLLLRRYVETGLIAHVSQPPWERIIQLDVEGPEGEVSLIVEPMERRSNILLVQQGVILDCLRRIGPDENRHRLSLPNHDYKLPPAQVGKLDPTRLQLTDLEAAFDHNDDPKRKTQQVLSSRLFGVSPLLAKEIIYRAGSELNQLASAADTDRLYDALQSVIQPLSHRAWQPGIASVDGRVTAYSVYPLQHQPGWEATPSVSAALTAFYGAPIGEEAYTAAKEPVRAELKEAIIRTQARLDSLQRSMTDEQDREWLRQSGELILAYQYTLQPGQTLLKAQYDFDLPELQIVLDPTLTPLENAQAYFTRYDKAKRALDDVPQLIRENQHLIAFLVQLDSDLDLATNWPEIDEVQQTLQQQGLWRGTKARKMAGSGQSAPLRVVTKDGFVIWVGRNSRQNDLVTFTKGGGQDWWFHARGVPGAHVILKADGRAIPSAILDDAASLAAYYSRSRSEGQVLVDCTRVAHVKRIKGAGPGMVTYRNEEPRYAAPRNERDIETA